MVNLSALRTRRTLLPRNIIIFVSGTHNNPNVVEIRYARFYIILVGHLSCMQYNSISKRILQYPAFPNLHGTVSWIILNESLWCRIEFPSFQV
jgi:hypothetical protein